MDRSKIKEVIKIVQGDITDRKVDAIVNAANNELILGAGVAGAIRRKGGPKIQEECDRIGPIKVGEAAITTAGNLPAKFVIHAASMGFGIPTTAKSLESSIWNSMKLAEENGVKSIAFPAIGTGVAGFPMRDCARITLSTITRYLENSTHQFELIELVLYDSNSYQIFKEEYEKFFSL